MSRVVEVDKYRVTIKNCFPNEIYNECEVKMSTIIKSLTEVKEDGSQRKCTSLTDKTILKETDAGSFFLNKVILMKMKFTM